MARLTRRRYGIVVGAALLPVAILDAVFTWGMLRYGWWAAALTALGFPFVVWAIAALEDYVRGGQ